MLRIIRTKMAGASDRFAFSRFGEKRNYDVCYNIRWFSIKYSSGESDRGPLKADLLVGLNWSRQELVPCSTYATVYE